MIYLIAFFLVLVWALVKWIIRVSLPVVLFGYGVYLIIYLNQELTGAILLVSSALFFTLFKLYSRGSLSQEFSKQEGGEYGER